MVSFLGGERRRLQNAMGYYIATAFRGNQEWETYEYDDTKKKVENARASTTNDVELLFYSD